MTTAQLEMKIHKLNDRLDDVEERLKRVEILIKALQQPSPTYWRKKLA
tara:strand:+ start:3626 stop:3769 length:144 start_codon:yes stop_codon:yes gene_type:complete